MIVLTVILYYFVLQKKSLIITRMTTEQSSSEEVVALLNAAQLSSNTDSAKLDNLRKVQEIIVNRDSNLLDNFLDEVLAFQTDRSQDVRKFVVGFIEAKFIYSYDSPQKIEV